MEKLELTNKVAPMKVRMKWSDVSLTKRSIAMQFANTLRGYLENRGGNYSYSRKYNSWKRGNETYSNEEIKLAISKVMGNASATQLDLVYKAFEHISIEKVEVKN